VTKSRYTPILLSDAEREAVEAAAKDRDVTVSEAIRQAIRQTYMRTAPPLRPKVSRVSALLDLVDI
jgi:hypothetical protein